MKLRHVLPLLFALFAITLPAQNYAVSGRTIGPEGEPEIYTTLRIYTPADTVHPVVVGVADEQGHFTQPLPGKGAYRLVATSVGRNPVVRQFEVTADAMRHDLGQLLMEPAVQHLGEVTVSQVRPLVSRDIDRFAYDVKADPVSATSPLNEILKKVPLVSVDPDGTIRVGGSTDFKIYKNGRPNKTYEQNAKDIFAALPASSIKRVEVITDPGTREDAEGSSMILNIVTDYNPLIKGVLGNVNVSASAVNPKPMGSIWLQSQIGKVNFGIMGNYFGINRANSKTRGETATNYFDSGNTMADRSKGTNNTNAGFGGFEVSYEPDTLRLLTVGFQAFMIHNDPRSTTRSSMLDAEADTLYDYISHVATNFDKYRSLGGDVNYQRSMRRQGETITLSYAFWHSDYRTDNLTTYASKVGAPFGYDSYGMFQHQKQLEQTVQLDWTRKIGKKGKLDLGGKGIFRNSNADNAYTYTPGTSMADAFTHINTVGAAFADYRQKFPHGWTLRGGVRYEYSYMAAKYPADAGHDDFNRRLNDWVPNAALSWDMNSKNNFKISFSRRISRPGIWNADPTVNETPQSVSFGNPEIESAVYNNFKFNYGLMTRRLMLQFDASYSYTNTGITNVKWAEGDRTFSTYRNVGHNRRLNFNIYLRWGMSKKTNVMVNAAVSRNEYIVPNASLCRWGTSGYMSVDQRLPWRLSGTFILQANLNGASNAYSWAVPSGNNFQYNISLTRSFLKENRLRVSLQLIRPFGPNHGWATSTRAPTATTRPRAPICSTA